VGISLRERGQLVRPGSQFGHLSPDFDLLAPGRQIPPFTALDEKSVRAATVVAALILDINACPRLDARDDPAGYDQVAEQGRDISRPLNIGDGRDRAEAKTGNCGRFAFSLAAGNRNQEDQARQSRQACRVR